MSDLIVLNLLAADLQMRGLADSTIREYGRIARQFLDTGPDLEHLDRYVVGGWIHAADTQSKRRWRYLATNAICRVLVEDGTLDANPCNQIKMPVEVEVDQPPLSEEEFSALLRSCDTKSFIGRRDRAIILALDSMGCRVSELAALKVADLDLDNCQATIREPKRDRNGRSKARIVYLYPHAFKVLLTYVRFRGRRTQGDHLWVTERGRPLGANGIQQMLARRGERLGFKASAHRFRRRFATTWLLSGASETGLMATGGWRSPTMPARYAAMRRTEIARADHARVFGGIEQPSRRTPRD